MKKLFFGAAVLLLLATLNVCFVTARAQGTAFTYQGRLNIGGAPANGLYDYRFKLYADPLGNTQVGSSYATNGIVVTNGLFITAIDFGAGIFTGGTNWLEVDVRTNGAPSYTASYTVLNPLQPVTPTPYAIFANTASNVSGTISAAQISGAVANGNLPTSPTVTGTITAGAFTGNGVNLTNVNAAMLNGLNATNFWQTGGNNVVAGKFIGSTNNQPVEIWANGARALRLEPGGASASLGNGTPTGAPNVVGGSPVNFVAGGVVGATIGGGGATNYGGVFTNSVASDFGTIGGGYNNTIQTNATQATISGGYNNTIQTNANDATISGGVGNTIQTLSPAATIGGGLGNSIQNYTPYSTIGGGRANTIQLNAHDSTIGAGDGNTIEINANYSTIGGGQANTIHSNGYASTIGGGMDNIIQPYASYSTIGGGNNNQATNLYATVPGGANNVAGGQYSFAAGASAQALHQGAFVWADSQGPAFSSTTNDEFSLRAQNGVRIQSQVGIHLEADDRPLIVRDWNPFAASATNNKANIGRWGLFMEPHNITIGLPGTDVGGSYFQVASYATSGAATRLLSVDQSGNVTATGTVTANGVLLTSDRNAKEHFAPLNPQAVLAKVAALPVTQWNYKTDPAGVQHIGPMAQDFSAAFGLDGSDNKHISVVDEGGVALAAIQGLNQKLEEQKAENAELKQRLAALEKLILNQKPN